MHVCATFYALPNKLIQYNTITM